MNSKKNVFRYKVEYFLNEVLNHPEVRELLNDKKLFAAILLIDELYYYSPKQYNALIETITY